MCLFKTPIRNVVKPKVYSIGGRKFRDYPVMNLGQFEDMRFLIETLVSSGGKVGEIVDELNKKQALSGALYTLLDPVDGKPVEPDFFRVVELPIATEVLDNFFTDNTESLAAFLSSLMGRSAALTSNVAES